MAILDLTDDAILQECRYMLDPSLTDEEVPDAVLTARPILKRANRKVLALVGMSESEYDALPVDDARREIFEDAAISLSTSELIPIVAQLVQVNANGLMTRFQEIDWLERKNQLYTDAVDLLDPYVVEDSDVAGSGHFYNAVSRESKRAL